MNVDTGDLTELVRQVGVLTEQAGALGRKVSVLTGRVTIMGAHLSRLDALVEDKLAGLARLVAVLLGAGPAHAPKHAAARPRHGLRAITGGKR